MSTETRAAIPVMGDEDIARTCLVAISVSLSTGLLACVGVLPLHWLPGQVAVTVLALAGLAAGTVWTTLRAATLSGLAAREFVRNAGLVRLALVALCCVILPVVEWRYAEGGAALASWRFAGPVAVALVLCTIASVTAEMNTQAWFLQHVQPWEDSERGSRLLAAGVPRDQLIAAIRTRWIAGGSLLAAALLLHADRASGETWQSLAGLAALAFHTLIGLVFLSLAARTRKTTHWRLTGYAVPAEVAGGWNRLSANAAVSILLAVALLLVFRVLDLAHIVMAWLVDDVLLSLLRRLNFDPPAFKPHSCTTCSPPHVAPPPLPRPMMPVKQTGETAGIWQLLGALWQALVHVVQLLVANWPIVLAVLVLLVLGRAFLGAGKRQAGVRILRALLSIVVHDLHAFVLLLWRPGRHLAKDARNLAETLAGRGVRRLRRWRSPSIEGLPARQAVITLYLAALEMAARRGHKRRSGQTPREFADELSRTVPGAHDTIEAMTDVFVEVRYGGHQAETTEITRLQSLWRGLRQALRGRQS